MLLLRPFVLGGLLLSSFASAQQKETFNYQSDVARLRKIVINSLYSHKEIFLRELISNANDALEKLRLTSLTDKSVWDGSSPLNITIEARDGSEDGLGPRVIITDTGIGMSPEELATNLGTLAKSGTSDFLARAESSGDTTNTGNLIGAFGLGFYSSFLVADKVSVASIPPKFEQNPEPSQHIFSSSADDSTFEIYPDPRGNTLGRGTEITLFLKDDSLEYLNTQTLSQLVAKHSSYSSSFPIFLLTKETQEVPIEDEDSETASSEASEAYKKPVEDGEAIVEEVEETSEEPAPVPKTKTVVVDKWARLNPAAPLWARTDTDDIDDAEYTMFYRSFFKDLQGTPLAWQHFSGDSGDGVSFKGLMFLPSELPDTYWQQPLNAKAQDVKLLVKRVFITNDLGEDSLPKWASWVKVVIDADDLPLNVSRETLQSTRFLKQLKSVILKRLIQLITRLAEEEPEKFAKLQESYGTVIKLGAIEDLKNREKLGALSRFDTNQRKSISLDQYLENKKQGQQQIFYLAEMGKPTEEIAKSVFVEKLNARGYEVLLLGEPLDEIFVQNIRQWKNVKFQDVAKAGLKFGDEDVNEEEEEEQQKELTEKYQQLIQYLKKEAEGVVRNVVISNRLVTSPCAIVADTHGYTANIQRMMSASNSQKFDIGHEFALKAKILEINPRSPLIEGLLRRVEQLPSEDEEQDPGAEAELKEVTSILIDGALVRSGFEVPNTNDFFARVDRVLRRSLGVPENAPTDDSVKAAPPVDPELPEEAEPEFSFADTGAQAGFQFPGEFKEKFNIEIEEIDDDGNVIKPHDEL